MTGEVVKAICIFICTSFMTGIFLLLKIQISRVLNRVNHLTDCMFTVFDAFKEQGVNGCVKKKMDNLKEQIIKD